MTVNLLVSDAFATSVSQLNVIHIITKNLSHSTSENAEIGN